MAVYQAVILLVPTCFIDSAPFSVEQLFDDEGYNDSSLAWQNHVNVEDVIASIDKYFERNNSWDEEIMIWGNESESDITLVYQGRRVTDLIVRVDRNNVVESWLERTNQLTADLSCFLFIPKNKVILEPNSNGFLRAISDYCNGQTYVNTFINISVCSSRLG